MIASEKQNVLGRLLVGLIGSLLLIACVAYLAGRSIVGALGRLADAAHSIAAGRLEERVTVRGRDEFAQLGRAFNQMASQLEGRLEDLEDERRRLREANARFGDALASALDPEQLRRVIVESAVEATQADGGVVIAEDGSYVETGNVGSGGERLDFELTSGRRSFGRLVLVGDEFDDEERMTAASLAGQAVVALENARLHRMVERQALVDGLTGLANRRQADEALASEIARTERLGGPVGLILADVDDFKAVNDRFGHPTGDVVLRDLAETLLENVREIDTAARWGGEEFAIILPAPTSREPRRSPSESGSRSPSARSSPWTARRCTSPPASVSRRRTPPPRCSSSSRRRTRRSTGRSAPARTVFTPGRIR